MSKSAQIIKPDQGRQYGMGRMSAIFKVDSDETDSAMSVSEWCLEAYSEGPHIHKHPEAHLFYILAGTLTVYLQDYGWKNVIKGSYVYIPGNLEHGFENRSDSQVGFISINTPGGFEKQMPQIVDYFKTHPLGEHTPE